MKKLAKYVSLAVLGIIVLLIFAGILTQTPLFRNWVKKIVFAAIDENFNTATTAKSLDGNLFTYVQIEDLLVTFEGYPLLKTKRLLIRYSPIGMFFKRLVIRELVLQEPEMLFMQNDQNHWNFLNLSNGSDSIPDTTQQTNSWSIIAPQISILGGTLIVNSATDSYKIPEKIRHINVNMGVWLEDDRTRFTISDLNFEASDPEFSVKNIRTDVEMGSENIDIQTLELETKNSNINSKLTIADFENPTIAFLFSGQPISFSEIRHVLPAFQLYGNARLEVEVRGPAQNLALKAALFNDRGAIEIAGMMNVQRAPYEYDLAGKVKNFDLGAITNREELLSDLNLQFRAAGSGIEPGRMNTSIVVDLDSSDFYNKTLEPSLIEVLIRDDTLSFDLKTSMAGAIGRFNGVIQNNKQNLLGYQLKGQVRSFKAERFFKSKDLKTNLDFDFALRGQGTELETIEGEAEINILPSAINDVQVDDSRFTISVKNEILSLQEFSLNTAAGVIEAKGDISLQKANALTVEGNFSDFSVFAKALPGEEIQGSGFLYARVEGPTDLLRFETNFELQQVGVKDILIDELDGKSSGLFSKTGFHFNFEAKASEISNAETKIDVIDFKSNYVDSLLNFNVDLKKTGFLNLSTSGQFRATNDTTSITLNKFDGFVFNQQWQQEERPALFRLYNSQIEISNFDLVSGDQSVAISGVFNSTAENGLSVDLRNFDITKYDSLFLWMQNFEGLVNVAMNLNGSLAKPKIRGSIEVLNGKYLETGFQRFVGELGYQEEKLTWRAVLSKATGDSLMESSGFVPLKLSLNPFETNFYRDDSLLCKLSSRGLELSFLQEFTPGVKNIKGTLVADIVLNHTLNDMHGIGPIRLVDGAFDIPELGTKYRNVNIALIIRENNILIRDFRMRSGGGYLEAVEGSISVSEQHLEEFGVKFKVKHFELMNNKKMKARAEGEISVSGSIQSPQVSGALVVDQARINYKEWIEEEPGVLLTSRPFFVISEDSVQFDSSGAIRFQQEFEATETSIKEMPLYKNLRGEITLQFPRNAWIRSDEVNLEINGELAAVKQGSDVVLFGSLSVMRGYYELLGRRFQIEQGSLEFKGKPEPDPNVSIEAVHEFRDDSGQSSEKHQFKVLVSGTLELPKFQFLLDGQEAKQEDVLSVLLFGKKYKNLTGGTGSNLSEDSGLEDQAAGIFTRQLMGTLTRKLGQELKLDVIQLERGSDWKDTKVRVGKYLTPEVFVSVSQDFSTEGNRQVELEYEIPKKIWFFNLFLQASTEGKDDTAMDVIWKIEW